MEQKALARWRRRGGPGGTRWGGPRGQAVVAGGGELGGGGGHRGGVWWDQEELMGAEMGPEGPEVVGSKMGP